MIDQNIWIRVIVSLAVILCLIVILAVARIAVGRFVARTNVKPGRGRFANKLLGVSFLGLTVFALLLIWGVDVRNLGLFISSVLGLVAIGFFAVWSILSNIVAGFFLFFSDPFRIEDEITVLPEDIRGTVTDIKLLFVVLKDADGNVLHVPNNLLFQRVIKKIAS